MAVVERCTPTESVAQPLLAVHGCSIQNKAHRLCCLKFGHGRERGGARIGAIERNPVVAGFVAGAGEGPGWGAAPGEGVEQPPFCVGWVLVFKKKNKDKGNWACALWRALTSA